MVDVELTLDKPTGVSIETAANVVHGSTVAQLVESVSHHGQGFTLWIDVRVMTSLLGCVQQQFKRSTQHKRKMFRFKPLEHLETRLVSLHCLREFRMASEASVDFVIRLRHC